MQVRFWGVRGSLPAPQLPSQVKSKISAILERVTPKDVENAESRERFLAGLPPWLFGTVGGNTPCVSVDFGNPGEVIVFDCGSGLRELGIAQNREKPRPSTYHIFFSHFHWDHLQGLPFFSPAYDPSVHINFYSPMPNLEDVLIGQMTSPYFPVHLESMGCKKTFSLIEGSTHIDKVTISCK
jgi:phosphoribosyl 1,2-cyclic phosphodiesterase